MTRTANTTTSEDFNNADNWGRTDGHPDTATGPCDCDSCDPVEAPTPKKARHNADNFHPTHKSKAALVRTIKGAKADIMARAAERGATVAALASFPEGDLNVLGESLKSLASAGRNVKSKVAYLSPSIESGRDTCGNATPECRAACLVNSGQLAMTPALNARLWKTALLTGAPGLFRELVGFEIKTLIGQVNRDKATTWTPAVRLNGTSDLARAPRLLAPMFPTVRFYDYTKSPATARAFVAGKLPANYHVTYSFDGTEKSRLVAREILAAGGTVAVCFNARSAVKGRREADKLPTTWEGFEVIDGDKLNGDARFLDPRGVVVGLTFKGEVNREAKIKAAGNFVQPIKAPRLLPVAR